MQITSYQIIQINATILAGILILFTIIAIQPIENERLEQYSEDKKKLDDKINNINAILDTVNQTNPSDEDQKKLFDVMRDTTLLIPEQTRLKTELESIKEEQNENEKFENNPKSQTYWGGAPFTFSAILGILSEIFEGHSSKWGTRFKVYSLSFMMLGFIALFFIFATIL